MQINTTLRFHFTPVSTAIIKNGNKAGLIPVVLPTWEEEIRRISGQGQSFLKNTNTKNGWQIG
jgi:hypothetical protein